MPVPFQRMLTQFIELSFTIKFGVFNFILKRIRAFDSTQVD